MAHISRKCPNCGAPYLAWDAFCSACGTELTPTSPDEEEVLDGVPLSDWHIFIDENASRYMELFSKHKDKKVFFSWNWSAFFFNVYWMFYRKMYKYALLFLMISLLFSAMLTTVVVSAFKPDFENAKSILEPYSQYLNDDGEYDLPYEDTDITSALQEAVIQYNRITIDIGRKMTVCIGFFSLLFCIGFGSLADWLYRSHIRQNILRKSGSTSGWSFVLGIAVYYAFNALIQNPVIQLITTKLLE